MPNPEMQLVRVLVDFSFGERALDVKPGTILYAPYADAFGWQLEGYVEFLDELKLPPVLDVNLQQIDWPLESETPEVEVVEPQPQPQPQPQPETETAEEPQPEKPKRGRKPKGDKKQGG